MRDSVRSKRSLVPVRPSVLMLMMNLTSLDTTDRSNSLTQLHRFSTGLLSAISALNTASQLQSRSWTSYLVSFVYSQSAEPICDEIDLELVESTFFAEVGS
ncbi:unnamed protein product [Protopolystoma xenopodis]|uniref:Uncharacterized protein n=1 Tax=Protopolystoma xenopodis TaxID=117903 RepID=A0A3S5FBU9_9PLAT|nr:unnamed protein product [Protopolystoma xenopodis]